MTRRANVHKENGTVEKMAQEAIEEARMVLPGIQALFGFQLIAAFNERFRQLADGEQLLHYAALVLVAIAIALIMTPAAYHRLVEQNSVSSFFIRLASRLMMAIAFEVFIIGNLVLSSPMASSLLLQFSFLLFAALWFGFPLAMKRRQED